MIVRELHSLAFLLAGVGVAALATTAFAGGGHGHGHAAIGAPGQPADAGRTVEITLKDNLFQPASIHVKPGETIRFVLHNTGDLLHEFNIGTARMHAAHRKEMAMMMERGMITPTGIAADLMQKVKGKDGHMAMSHDDPNAVLVEPGENKEMTWTFPTGGTLEIACNLPGHYEAGMVGRIRMDR